MIAVPGSEGQPQPSPLAPLRLVPHSRTAPVRLGRTQTIIIASVVCGVVFLLLLGITVYLCCRRRRRREQTEKQVLGMENELQRSVSSFGSSCRQTMDSGQRLVNAHPRESIPSTFIPLESPLKGPKLAPSTSRSSGNYLTRSAWSQSESTFRSFPRSDTDSISVSAPLSVGASPLGNLPGSTAPPRPPRPDSMSGFVPSVVMPDPEAEESVDHSTTSHTYHSCTHSVSPSVAHSLPIMHSQYSQYASPTSNAHSHSHSHSYSHNPSPPRHAPSLSRGSLPLSNSINEHAEWSPPSLALASHPFSRPAASPTGSAPGWQSVDCLPIAPGSGGSDGAHTPTTPASPRALRPPPRPQRVGSRI